MGDFILLLRIVSESSSLASLFSTLHQERGKGWSFRLPLEGKAGAFAYLERGKGWSLRLRPKSHDFGMAARMANDSVGCYVDK